MKIAVVVLGLLAFAGTSRAACPNACSGHGTCGVNDQCICHTNFEGGDCSQRVCPYGMAWATTANGDVNFDGDRYDGTQYNKDYSFENNPLDSQLATQRSPGGEWESWPYDAKAGEGHFYMECSNRGTCSRDTGDCQCFEGYDGSSCQRSTCPSGCSGHGKCSTIRDMGYFGKLQHEKSSRQLGTFDANYVKWDSGMQRTCLCDHGYTGIACNQRNCPIGDDPLTTHAYLNAVETQFIDIESKMEFEGTVKFVYNAPDGETYVTAAIDTEGYHDSTRGDAAALAVQTALRALPTGDLQNVIVSASRCETPIAGYHKITYAGTDETATATISAATSPYPTHSSADSVYTPSDGFIREVGTDGLYDVVTGILVEGYKLQASGASDDTVLFWMKPGFGHCIRYAVSFQGRSGNVIDLGVITRGIESATTAPAIEGDSSSDISLTGDVATITISNGETENNFVAGDKVFVTCGGLSQGFMEVSGVQDSAELNALAATYHAEDCTGIVKIYLVSSLEWSMDDQQVKGQVAESVTTTDFEFGKGAHMMYSVEYAKTAACDADPTVACAGRVVLCDFTSTVEGTDDETDGGAIRTAAGVSTLSCPEATENYGQDGSASVDLSANLHHGERVVVICDGKNHGTYTIASSTADTLVFEEVMHDCKGDYINNADGVTTADRNVKVEVYLKDNVFKSNIDFKAAESDGQTIIGRTIEITPSGGAKTHCAVTAILSDSAAAPSMGSRLVCSNTGSDASIAATSDLSLVTDGGSEGVTCSDRGLCNFESGNCECFSGYVGVACETQNVLHM